LNHENERFTGPHVTDETLVYDGTRKTDRLAFSCLFFIGIARRKMEGTMMMMIEKAFCCFIERDASALFGFYN